MSAFNTVASSHHRETGAGDRLLRYLRKELSRARPADHENLAVVAHRHDETDPGCAMSVSTSRECFSQSRSVVSRSGVCVRYTWRDSRSRRRRTPPLLLDRYRSATSLRSAVPASAAVFEGFACRTLIGSLEFPYQGPEVPQLGGASLRRRRSLLERFLDQIGERLAVKPPERDARCLSVIGDDDEVIASGRFSGNRPGDLPDLRSIALALRTRRRTRDRCSGRPYRIPRNSRR